MAESLPVAVFVHAALGDAQRGFTGGSLSRGYTLRNVVMKFSLVTIAYVFALLAAGMALFGPLGILASGLVLLFWALMLAKPRQAVWMWLGVVAFVVIALFLLAPAVATARNAALRNQCLNNLKQIMLALETYRRANGAYPPAYIADAAGEPMHSWRVLILPYMEQQELYEAYNFDEPWDGPNNRKLWDRMPDVYECPEVGACRQFGCPPCDKRAANIASYVAIVGESTAWPGGRVRATAELIDPPSQTLLVLEYSGATQPWTAPVDLSLNEAIGLLEAGPVQGHLHTNVDFFTVSCSSMLYLAGFGDGRARALWPAMSPAVAEAMLTVAGGEDVAQWESDGGSRERQTDFGVVVRWGRVYAAIVFGVLAVLPVAPVCRKVKSCEGSPAAR